MSRLLARRGILSSAAIAAFVLPKIARAQLLSPNQTDTTLIQNGQAPGSITPTRMQLMNDSLAGRYPNAQTGSYTAQAADKGTVTVITSPLLTAYFTIPLNVFPVGTMLGLCQGGPGPVSFASSGAGVTVTPKSGYSLFVAQQGSIAYAWQISTNVWYVFGELQSTTLNPPPQAIAAGFTRPVLIDQFAANSINYNGSYVGGPTFPNWFTANGETTPLTNLQTYVQNGQLFIQTCNSFAIGLCSCPLNFGNTTGNNSVPGNTVAPNANGLTFTQGYFEVVAQFPGTYVASPGYPTAALVSTMVDGSVNYPRIEFDILSGNPSGGAGSAIAPTNTIFGRVNGSTTQLNGSNTVVVLPAGFSFSQFHKYGLLWTPSVAAFYLDDQLVSLTTGANPVNAASSPAYSAFSPEITTTLGTNVGGCNLILGSGTNMQTIFKSVGVWQS